MFLFIRMLSAIQDLSLQMSITSFHHWSIHFITTVYQYWPLLPKQLEWQSHWTRLHGLVHGGDKWNTNWFVNHVNNDDSFIAEQLLPIFIWFWLAHPKFVQHITGTKLKCTFDNLQIRHDLVNIKEPKLCCFPLKINMNRPEHYLLAKCDCILAFVMSHPVKDFQNSLRQKSDRMLSSDGNDLLALSSFLRKHLKHRWSILKDYSGKGSLQAHLEVYKPIWCKIKPVYPELNSHK